MPSDGQEGHWDKTYAGNPTFFGEGPSEFAHTAMNLFKDAGVRSVLELGCGQGRDTLFFAKEGFDVLALDYSEEGLGVLSGRAEEARLSRQVATQVFDVRKPLPFPDGSFDACYSHMLLCMELSTEELTFLLWEVRRMQEGNLPRELYAVALKKTDLDARSENAKEGGNMADSMGKYEEFFHDVYHTGVLDGKTKHLVALGASLAAGCES